MAEEASRETTVREVVAALQVFAVLGLDHWKRQGNPADLAAIGDLPVVANKVKNGTSQIEAICEAIDEACQDLEDEWENAALDHLGYAEDSPPARTYREDNAARRLKYLSKRSGKGISGKAYRAKANRGKRGPKKEREYRGVTAASWSELTLRLVAEALIQQGGNESDVPANIRSVDRQNAQEADLPARLGDVIRHEISGLYQPIDWEDFDKSFFHRSSTDAYIEQLASLSAVTLYTGAGVSADVRAPLSDRLMARSLRERLRTYSSSELNDKQRKRVVKALSDVYPPTYLGSIAKELVRQHSDSDPKNIGDLEHEARDVFLQDLKTALEAGRDTGGFLALGLGALALAFRKAGKSPIRILTTNYDDRLVESEARIHNYFADLKGFSLKRYALQSSEDPDEDIVPLYSLNGHLKAARSGTADPLIIGEADSLTEYYIDRRKRIDEALTDSTCIFIGDSLTEADVLARLVNTCYSDQLPRYALVLAPDLQLEEAKEKAKALNLVAQRFLHFGVVPIVIDFPHQVPQFLIELSLRLYQGSSYRNYANRLDDWWSAWAKDFGYGPGHGKDGGKRNRELQELWLKVLERVRRSVITSHLALPGRQQDRDEQIQVEVWIRHPGTRSLTLWATSECIWLNANSAHRCYIHEGSDFAVQQAFRKGTPVFDRINPPRGRWRYQVSIPLVLRREPWYHLPVGVVSILSSKQPPDEDEEGKVSENGGRLGALEKDESFPKNLARLASDIKKPINELLDPSSALCRKKGLGAYSTRRR